MSVPEPRNNNEVLNMDAFSDGQMRSKLWLCHELEKILDSEKSHTIWIYGAWYGTLALLLLAREKVNIKKIHLFDIDPEAIKIARKVLDTWLINGPTVKIHQTDCMTLDPSHLGEELESSPDIIINTSCEHFESEQWLHLIPRGTTLVLQSTDMLHPTHIQCSKSIDEFKSRVALSEIHFSGTMSFNYPNFEFRRFMLIGTM